MSACAHLAAFKPGNPAKLRGDAWKINNRDHRKMLIVDGRSAGTGGVNISDTYAKSSLLRAKAKDQDKSDVGWRDSHPKVEGTAVAAFQWLFLRSGTLPGGNYFPVLSAVGDKLLRVVASEPGGGFDIDKAYILAIEEARQSVHITCAYFVGRRPEVARAGA